MKDIKIYTTIENEIELKIVVTNYNYIPGFPGSYWEPPEPDEIEVIDGYVEVCIAPEDEIDMDMIRWSRYADAIDEAIDLPGVYDKLMAAVIKDEKGWC